MDMGGALFTGEGVPLFETAKLEQEQETRRSDSMPSLLQCGRGAGKLEGDFVSFLEVRRRVGLTAGVGGRPSSFR